MKDGTLGFGIDIGGTGMKAAVVDLETGKLTSKRHRIPTPRDSAPRGTGQGGRRADRSTTAGRARSVSAFPSIVRHGVVELAANIDESWVGVDADAVFAEASRAPRAR